MATIGNLAVTLSANSSSFTRGMQRAQKTTSTFKQSMTRSAATAVKFGGALTALATGGGLALMLKRTFANVDATAKLSARLGIATDKLAGFKLAAKLGGSSAETMTSGLETMTKRLGEASMGTGEARAALAAMGLDVDNLISMSPDQAFKRIADGIAGYGTTAEQAAAANKIFGRSGIELLNVLQQGSAGIEKAQAETRRFGTAITAIDAAKIEATNDAFTRIGEVFDGLKTRLAVGLAPALEMTADKMLALVDSSKLFGSEGTSGVSKFAGSLGVLADVVQTIGIAWKGLHAITDKWFAFVGQQFNQMVQGVDQLLQFVGGGLPDSLTNFTQGFAENTAISAKESSRAFWDAWEAPTASSQMAKSMEKAQQFAADAASGPAGALGDDGGAFSLGDFLNKQKEAAMAFRSLFGQKGEGKETAEPFAAPKSFSASGALERGSVEAVNAVNRAMLGATEDKAKEQTKKNTEQTARNTAELLNSFDRWAGQLKMADKI